MGTAGNRPAGSGVGGTVAAGRPDGKGRAALVAGTDGRWAAPGEGCWENAKRRPEDPDARKAVAKRTRVAQTGAIAVQSRSEGRTGNKIDTSRRALPKSSCNAQTGETDMKRSHPEKLALRNRIFALDFLGLCPRQPCPLFDKIEATAVP